MKKAFRKTLNDRRYTSLQTILKKQDASEKIKTPSTNDR